MAAATHADHLANLELLKMARASLSGLTKRAFIPAGDPSMGGGAPPGGDPSGGGGGAPPPGGDPSGGGAPPPDPSGGAGAGAPPPGPDPLMQKLDQLISMMGQGGGAGGAGGAPGAGALKPKVDQNVISVQILKALARICDHLGIQVPMSDMVPGMNDLGQLAQASQGAGPMPGADASGGAGGGAGGGAVQPVQPMGGMAGSGVPGMGGGEKTSSYRSNGDAFDASGYAALDPLSSDGFVAARDRATAIMQRRRELQRVGA